MKPVFEIRALAPHEWKTLRDLRLRALGDSPESFSKTVAEEAAYDDAEWKRRAGAPGTWPPVRWVVAQRDEEFGGLACGRIEPERPEIANVFSMWVDPRYRQCGLGGRLLSGIIEWASTVGAKSLVLGVAASSEAAMRLYLSAGFAPTAAPGPAGQPSLRTPSNQTDETFIVMERALTEGEVRPMMRDEDCGA